MLEAGSWQVAPSPKVTNTDEPEAGGARGGCLHPASSLEMEEPGAVKNKSGLSDLASLVFWDINQLKGELHVRKSTNDGHLNCCLAFSYLQSSMLRNSISWTKQSLRVDAVALREELNNVLQIELPPNGTATTGWSANMSRQRVRKSIPVARVCTCDERLLAVKCN